MLITKPATPDEMVLAFLRAELFSPRFQNEVLSSLAIHAASEALITDANLNDDVENALRGRVLGEYRGWQRGENMFSNWPHYVAWYWAKLGKEDIGNLRYVVHGYWDELSNNTHLVRDGALSVRSGKEVIGESNESFWEVAGLARKGIKFQPLILRARSIEGPYELVEGHHRATAYYLADLPAYRIPAILAVEGSKNSRPFRAKKHVMPIA